MSRDFSFEEIDKAVSKAMAEGGVPRTRGVSARSVSSFSGIKAKNRTHFDKILNSETATVSDSESKSVLNSEASQKTDTITARKQRGISSTSVTSRLTAKSKRPQISHFVESSILNEQPAKSKNRPGQADLKSVDHDQTEKPQNRVEKMQGPKPLPRSLNRKKVIMDIKPIRQAEEIKVPARMRRPISTTVGTVGDGILKTHHAKEAQKETSAETPKEVLKSAPVFEPSEQIENLIRNSAEATGREVSSDSLRENSENRTQSGQNSESDFELDFEETEQNNNSDDSNQSQSEVVLESQAQNDEQNQSSEFGAETTGNTENSAQNIAENNQSLGARQSENNANGENSLPDDLNNLDVSADIMEQLNSDSMSENHPETVKNQPENDAQKNQSENSQSTEDDSSKGKENQSSQAEANIDKDIHSLFIDDLAIEKRPLGEQPREVKPLSLNISAERKPVQQKVNNHSIGYDPLDRPMPKKATLDLVDSEKQASEFTNSRVKRSALSKNETIQSVFDSESYTSPRVERKIETPKWIWALGIISVLVMIALILVVLWAVGILKF